MAGKGLSVQNIGILRVRQRGHGAGADVALSGVEVKERVFTALDSSSPHFLRISASPSRISASPSATHLSLQINHNGGHSHPVTDLS